MPLISGRQLLVLRQPQLLGPVNPDQNFQSGTVLLRCVKNFSHAEVNVSGRKQGRVEDGDVWRRDRRRGSLLSSSVSAVVLG